MVKAKILKVNSKSKVVYFIRHPNDFTYSEELFRTVTESIIIFYGPAAFEDEIMKRALKLGVNFYSVSRYYDAVFLALDRLVQILVPRLLSFLKLQKTYDRKYSAPLVFSKILAKRVKVLIKKNSVPLKAVNCYAFDHTVTPLAIELIKLLREINNFRIPIVALPHGAYIFENRMLDAYELAPKEKIDYKIYDHVVCNDQGHAGIISGNTVVIPCLRYTNESLKSAGQNNGVKTSNPRILILHTKFVGNIFENEFIRCVRIIKEIDGLAVFIRPHPRGRREVIRCLGTDVEYSKVGVSVECDIKAADVVVMFGSTAVFDVFLMGKPVIFPRYATSNQINPLILKECNVANSPDEFYELVTALVNKSHLKIPHWNFPIKLDLENTWRDFFANLEFKELNFPN